MDPLTNVVIVGRRGPLIMIFRPKPPYTAEQVRSIGLAVVALFSETQEFDQFVAILGVK